MATSRTPYPSDLTDAQWAILAPLPAQRAVAPARPGGRPRTADVREVVSGVLYVLRSGCDWRILPHDLPPHDTVYGYFRDWQRTGAWEGMHDTLRERGCVKRGREPSPSAAIIHSQRVKTTGKGAARPRRGQEDQRTQAA